MQEFLSFSNSITRNKKEVNVEKKCHRDRKNIVSLQNGKNVEKWRERENKSLQKYSIRDSKALLGASINLYIGTLVKFFSGKRSNIQVWKALLNLVLSLPVFTRFQLRRHAEWKIKGGKQSKREILAVRVNSNSGGETDSRWKGWGQNARAHIQIYATRRREGRIE